MPKGKTREDLEQKVRDLKAENRSLKTSLAAFQKREATYQFLTENITDVLFFQDMDLRLSYVSPSVTTLFGYTVEEAMALKMEDIMTPDSLAIALSSFHHAVPLAQRDRSLDIPLMEYDYVRKDGSTFRGELKVSFVYDAKGQAIGIQGILRNIDERLKADEALRESEFKFRSLFDLSPQAISLSDRETGIFLDVNHRFCEQSGYEKHEILGRTILELGFYQKKDRAKVLEELKRSGEVQGMEMDFKVKDGTTKSAMIFAKAIVLANRACVLSFLFDTTERKILEAQLIQAQKLEALGNLAGGIAHDFNNLLMAIMGNVSLSLLDMNPDHPHFAMLKNIEKQVLSGASLTRQLLGYARKGQYEVRTVNLNQLVEEIAESFNRTRKDITIHKKLSDDLHFLEADRGQIEQVLWNLFINAADAMGSGGELLLETLNATHQDMKCYPYIPKAGRYIQLKVADTGIGMDKKTQDRIFDPFFTTKEMGRGTGLGLASVYGIVKGHGGYIDVESQLGKGTTFMVYFPASDRKPLVSAISQGRPLGGKGTILLVDDEERVLHITAKLLEHLGYRVLKAKGGREAVATLKEGPDRIDLVILDVVMPEMSGASTFEKLKEIHPEIKVLLSTGFSLQGQALNILELGGKGFIQKPFKLEELSKKIREIMDTP